MFVSNYIYPDAHNILHFSRHWKHTAMSPSLPRTSSNSNLQAHKWQNFIQYPAKVSPCSSSSSSQFSSRNSLKFPHSPLPFPSQFSHGISIRFICSCQSSKPSDSSPEQDSVLLSIIRAIPDWVDSVKERGMKKKRSLYGHDNWVQHRSSSRHLRHFLTSLTSRVILSLFPPVILFTSVAAVIASYNSAVSLQWLPEFFPILRSSSLPYQLTAPALALLLVFRTEASYSRFEEGKKAWTRVIAGTNDLARQVMASLENTSDEKLKMAILQYVMAFPVALKCHIIYESDAAQDLQHLLNSDDLAIVLSSKHRPRCIIDFISQSLQLLDMEATKLNILESKLLCFHEGIETCEQLIGMPIPLSYTRLTSRFLVLWHLTLPIILWDECHWNVVPATFISAASLFCIEEVGVLIEEPFPMLALEEMCVMVERNIGESIRNEKLIRDRVKAIQMNHRPRKQSPNGWTATSLEDHHLS